MLFRVSARFWKLCLAFAYPPASASALPPPTSACGYQTNLVAGLSRRRLLFSLYPTRLGVFGLAAFFSSLSRLCTGTHTIGFEGLFGSVGVDANTAPKSEELQGFEVVRICALPFLACRLTCLIPSSQTSIYLHTHNSHETKLHTAGRFGLPHPPTRFGATIPPFASLLGLRRIPTAG